MIDKEKLFAFVVIVISVYIFSVFGYLMIFGKLSAPSEIGAVIIILVAIHSSLISNKLQIDIKGRLETDEVQTLLRKEKDLAAALQYALSLDSADLVRFVRLIVEARDAKSQEALKELKK